MLTFIMVVAGAILFVSIVGLMSDPACKINRKLRHHRRRTKDYTGKENWFIA